MIVVNDILYVAVSTECHQIDQDSVEIICGPVDVTNYVDISGIATCMILACICNDEKLVEFKFCYKLLTCKLTYGTSLADVHMQCFDNVVCSASSIHTLCVCCQVVTASSV